MRKYFSLAITIDRLMWRTKQEAAAYLAGIIDGEGHIGLYKHKTKPNRWNSRLVEISNTDMSIIQASAAACSLLELTFNVRDYTRYNQTNKKSEYRLTIYGKENCEILLREVPIRASHKRAKLQELVDSFMVTKPRSKVPGGGDAIHARSA